MRAKKIYAALLLMVISMAVYAAVPFQISNDLFKFGDNSDGSNKVIEADRAGSADPFIHFDVIDDRWEFSNDGSVENAFGSGAGSQNEYNLLGNPDAEAGLGEWTFSGSGSFTSITSGQYRGDASFQMDGDATLDSVTSDQYAVKGLAGTACEANFRYKTAADGFYKIQAIDSGSSVLGESELLPETNGLYALHSAYFLCPELESDTVAFRIIQETAGDPAVIDFDDAHLGNNLGLGESFDMHKDYARITPTFNNQDVLTLSFDQVFFKVEADALRIRGRVDFAGVSAVGSNIQLNMPAGYTIDYDKISNTGGSASFIVGSGGFFDANVASPSQNVAVNVFTNPAAPDVMTFAARVGSGSAVGGVSALDLSNGGRLEFELEVPINESISGPATVFRSIPKIANNINSFSATSDNAGVISNENANWLDGDCSSGGAGVYNCSFLAGVFSAAPNCTCTTETATSSDRVCFLEAGTLTNTGVTVGTENSSGVAANSAFQLKCQKGASDFKMPVVQPVLVKQVETSVKVGVTTENCKVNADGGTPLVDSGSGLCETWIDSVTDLGGNGRYRLELTAGVFGIEPSCQCTSATPETGYANICTIGTESTTQINIRIKRSDTSADEDSDFHVQCTGKR